MQCGSRKTSHRTSTIVQLIFHFWSFEISKHILRNQNIIIGLDSFSRPRFIYLDPILIYMSLNQLLIWNSQNCSMFSPGFCCKVITGSLMRLFSRNFEVWPIYFLTIVFTALKGTHFCISIKNLSPGMPQICLGIHPVWSVITVSSKVSVLWATH